MDPMQFSFSLCKENEPGVSAQPTGRTKPFVCDQCNQGFFKEVHLKLHICRKEEDLDEEELEQQCDICHKVYQNKKSLEKHYLIHTNEKRVECHICKKTVCNKQFLKIHYRIHTNERPFECEVCKKNFATRCALNSHQKRIHLQQKCFSCTQCGREFLMRWQLTKHTENRHTDKVHQCPECNETFDERPKLRQHAKLHEPHPCPFCIETFSSKLSVVEHIVQLHSTNAFFTLGYRTEQPPRMVYPCGVCHELFETMEQMHVHCTRMHIGEQLPPVTPSECSLFACSICTYKFQSAPQLKRHMKKAHGVNNPHTCNLCQKSFNLQNDLVVHFLTHSQFFDQIRSMSV